MCSFLFSIVCLSLLFWPMSVLLNLLLISPRYLQTFLPYYPIISFVTKKYKCHRCTRYIMWSSLSVTCGRLVVCQLLAAGWLFSPGYLVSSTNKADPYDITEVALNTINQIKVINLCNVIYWQ
jgi:hypothetical protein